MTTKPAEIVDPEILDCFVEEIQAIKLELLPIIKAVTENVNQPACFVKFSQVIDRIYGTAMTLGFKEVGEYTFMLKNLTKACGESGNANAMASAKELIFVCVHNLTRLAAGIHSPKEIYQLKVIFINEIEKARLVSKRLAVDLKKVA